MPSSRRNLLSVAALLPLAACSAFRPRHLALSQDELQALLERQFPRRQRLLELFDVSLSRPTVRLLPERNRIATALDLLATERVSGRALSGSLALEHGLRWEPADASVRLSQVRVDAVRLELAGTPLSGQAARLGSLLAEQLLEGVVVYRLSDERRQQLAGAGVNNVDIEVTHRGVELRFAPAR